MDYPQNLNDFSDLAKFGDYKSSYILFVPARQLRGLESYDFIKDAGEYTSNNTLFAISGFMLEDLYKFEEKQKAPLSYIGLMTSFQDNSMPISFDNGYVLNIKLDSKIRNELQEKTGFTAKVEKTSVVSIDQEGNIEVIVNNKSVSDEYLRNLMHLFSNGDLNNLGLFKAKIDSKVAAVKNSERVNKAIDDFLESFSKKSGENLASSQDSMLKTLIKIIFGS